MTTAQEILNEAAENIGLLGEGQSLPGETTSRLLAALNTMLDAWNAERATIYALREETFTLPSAAATRTIGPAGQFVTTRPVKIEWAFVRVDNTDYPIEVVSSLAQATIPYKADPAGWPCILWYQPASPSGLLTFVPPPSESFELHLGTWTPLSSFATPGTSVSLPPGYKEALVANLTMRIAPKYDRSVAPETAALAASSKRAIKRANAEPLTPVASDAAMLSYGGYSNIITG